MTTKSRLTKIWREKLLKELEWEQERHGLKTIDDVDAAYKAAKEKGFDKKKFEYFYLIRALWKNAYEYLRDEGGWTSFKSESWEDYDKLVRFAIADLEKVIGLDAQYAEWSHETLADLYCFGEPWHDWHCTLPVFQDIKKAAYHYEKSGAKGRALNMLGLFYFYGIGGKEKCEKTAFECFTNAVGDGIGYETARYNVAVCLEKGWGVKKDTKKALGYYKELCRQSAGGEPFGNHGFGEIQNKPRIPNVYRIIGSLVAMQTWLIGAAQKEDK